MRRRATLLLPWLVASVACGGVYRDPIGVHGGGGGGGRGGGAGGAAGGDGLGGGGAGGNGDLGGCDGGSSCGGDAAGGLCLDGGCVPAARIIQIAAGNEVACALRNDGAVACWGSNNAGVLGTLGAPSGRPRVVPLPGAATRISVGDRQACAVVDDGALWCWGDVAITTAEGNGVVGPQRYPGLPGPVADVSVSIFGNGCAALTSGLVTCWGRNDVGQLGADTTDAGFTAPTVLPTLTGAVEVAHAGDHACARLASDVVYCWGRNQFGEAGTGTIEPQTMLVKPTPILHPSHVTAIAFATRIAAGDRSSFALVGGGNGDGALMVWGIDPTATLETGAFTFRPTPQRIDAATTFRAIATSLSFSCAVTTAGDVRCWGPGIPNQALPTVPALSNVTAVASGWNAACAVVAGDRIMCWGNNDAGQLGDVGLAGGPDPVLVDW